VNKYAILVFLFYFKREKNYRKAKEVDRNPALALFSRGGNQSNLSSLLTAQNYKKEMNIAFLKKCFYIYLVNF
jgi:hypothetical protein